MINQLMIQRAATEAAIRVSPVERALFVADQKWVDDKRGELSNKSAEAAVTGNPARARRYDEWAERI